MTGSDEIDLSELVDDWAKITVKILQTKLARLKIRNTGSLYDSLKFSVSGHNTSFSIYFNYNLYGMFVDMGVGRNFYVGNPGDVGTVRKQRKRKEWESRILYAQMMVLGELARKQCGEDVANNIVSSIRAVNDLKSGRYK